MKLLKITAVISLCHWMKDIQCSLVRSGLYSGRELVVDKTMRATHCQFLLILIL